MNLALFKPRELLGHPYSRIHHNVVGNDKRDGLKRIRIGQSAAKLPGNRVKVQRSAYGVLPGFVGKMVKCHECGAMFFLYICVCGDKIFFKKRRMSNGLHEK